MYTKEELESMDITKLVTVASELGIKVSPNDQLENVVYAILDKAAEESAANTTSKRKRTRIVKKDTDKVSASLKKALPQAGVEPARVSLPTGF